MSESATYRYRIIEERRRQLEQSRAREVAQRTINACNDALHKLEDQGLSSYVPTELADAKHQLAAMQGSLHADPVEVQRRGMELNISIAKVRSLAVAVKQRMEKEAMRRIQQFREERHRAASEMQSFLDRELRAFTDPVVRDFALEGVRAIQAKIGQDMGPDEVAGFKLQIRNQLSSVKSQAEAKAKAWKAKKASELETQTRQTTIDMVREQVAVDSRENPEAIAKILAILDQARDSLSSGQSSFISSAENVVALVQRAETAVMGERIRRETVKAIMRSLSDVGLVLVGRPSLIRDENRDEVVLLARKASGHEASFRIKLDGEFVYRFEGYEGSACKQDIKQLHDRMQAIYGIKLSDKRVVWENPDRLTADAHPITSDITRRRHD